LLSLRLEDSLKDLSSRSEKKKIEVSSWSSRFLFLSRRSSGLGELTSLGLPFVHKIVALQGEYQAQQQGGGGAPTAQAA